jgi:hypothetical protein
MMTLLLVGVFIVGWTAAAVLGTQAYFRGEQSKPIHERNWNNDSFDRIAESVTGTQTDYSERVPAFSVDPYIAGNLSN